MCVHTCTLSLSLPQIRVCNSTHTYLEVDPIACSGTSEKDKWGENVAWLPLSNQPTHPNGDLEVHCQRGLQNKYEVMTNMNKYEVEY